MVASRIVDGILEGHPDLRWVWWLSVATEDVDDLADHARRLWDVLEYHDRRPETYVWFLTETADRVGRYLIADRCIDEAFLDRYWVDRYDGLKTRVFRLDRRTLRREIAALCGRVSVDTGRRMGSAASLPGVSPRRYSSGRATPPSNEIAYAAEEGTTDV